MSFSNRVPRSAWVILALLLLSACVLRFTQLQDAPAGGQGDTSWVGINALDWVDRGVWPFYVRELYSPEFFPVYLTGLLLPITGISQLPQRLITATSGVLLVFSLFWATWWLLAQFPPRRRVWSALAAAAAGTFSIQATYLSRLGMESPPFMLTVTLFVWATAWAWQRGGIGRWALAGFLLGLNQYIYLPARLLPIVLALWLSFVLLTQRQRFREQFRGFVAAAGVALLIALPAILLFISTPATFSARADQGTQITGGWIWLYDTTPYGGIVGLFVQKLLLTLQGIGLTWSAEYSIMGQPMLPPLFFLGFIAAVLLTARYWKSTAFAWCWLAIPVLLITDLISGGFPVVHGLHQMGILPFIFILSGIGLGFTLDRLATLLNHSWARLALAGGVAFAAAIPSAFIFSQYLNDYTLAQVREPDFYWTKAQADLDMARYMNAHRDQTFLLPISEYTRPDEAWFVAAGFRQRHSAIDAEGHLKLPSLPAQMTVVMPIDPQRPRHDGHPAHFDLDQWVLLQDNTIYLLPMLSEQTVDTLSAALDGGTVDSLVDRSGSEIADFVTVPSPDLFPSAQPVIQHPLDATFDDTIKLVGYSSNRLDIEPGAFVDLTLYFQPLKAVPEDYDVFAQLWTDAKNSVASSEEAPYSGMYRSRIWDTDEIVPVHLWLQAPADLSRGRYTLVMGLYRALKDQRLTVTGENALADDGVAAALDFRYPLPAVKVDTSHLTHIDFGDTLQFSLESSEVNEEVQQGAEWNALAGAQINLHTIWQVLKRPPQDYSVFLHLVVAADQPPLAQSDSLIRPDYPTGAWRPGDQFENTLSLTLPADIATGTYDLVAGVYFWQTGERLTVASGQNTLSDNRIRLGRIHVTSP